MSNQNERGQNSVPMAKVEQLVNKKVEDRLDQVIEVRSDDDSITLDDIWLCGIPLGKIVNGNRERVEKVQNEVREAPSSTDEPQGKSGENRSQSADLLPIERLAKMEDDEDASSTIMADTTPSVERAVILFENFHDWSKKTPKGRTITSGLRDLLSAATGERLAWRQVYRTLDKIEEWSKGAIRHEQTSQHGHVLVADERASSVATG